MGKLRATLCLLCLMLLIPALIQAHRILPLNTSPLVSEKYAGWSGVLSLWVFEGWPCGNGSIAPWLNQCVTSFEKNHPGVYVQPQYVDAGAIASMSDSGILPPNMVLIPPNLLETPKGLMSLELPGNLRPALCRCGTWNGSLYAVPVAVGGYLWAWNTALTETIPDNWREVDAVLSVPTPQPWRRWDAALLALCSGRYNPSSEPNGSPGSTLSPTHEVELGLTGGEATEPVPLPNPCRGLALPRHLPSGFQFDDDAWRHFINGESAAMPVTQREIRRLQSLSEQGKGPDWKLCPGDGAFTDQLLSLAILNQPDADPRVTLCRDFLAHLLSDECQSNLSRAAAFAVTDTRSGYDASDPLAIMDAALHDASLCVPRIFDGKWSDSAEAIVRKYISDTEDAPVLWRQLRDILS